MKYEALEIELVTFNDEDVVTASPPCDTYTEGDPACPYLD